MCGHNLGKNNKIVIYDHQQDYLEVLKHEFYHLKVASILGYNNYQQNQTEELYTHKTDRRPYTTHVELLKARPSLKKYKEATGKHLLTYSHN